MTVKYELSVFIIHTFDVLHWRLLFLLQLTGDAVSVHGKMLYCHYLKLINKSRVSYREQDSCGLVACGWPDKMVLDKMVRTKW